MEIFLSLFVWCWFALVVGVAANTRGYSGALWGILSLFISPLLTITLLLALPRYTALVESETAP